MEVQRFGTTRQELPAHLTECVKAMGRSLTTNTRENEETKARIGYINQVAVFDWDRGIFRITFTQGGNPRFHRLSPERNAELQARDSYVQEVVNRVSTEIVDGMKLFQQTVQLPIPLHDAFRKKLETQDATLKEILDLSGVVETYHITAEDRILTVFALIDRDQFNMDPIFKEIMSKDEFNTYFNHKLIQSFLLSCPVFLTPGNPPKIMFRPTEAVTPTLMQIHNRYHNPETGMAQDATAYVNNSVQEMASDPRSHLQVMIVVGFLALLRSHPAP